MDMDIPDTLKETLEKNDIPFLDVYEQKRKCGYRKAGGLYFVQEVVHVEPCLCMPIPLVVCPCCGVGFNYSRSPSWINLNKIVTEYREKEAFVDCFCEVTHRRGCIVCSANKERGERVLLMWIGEEFYKPSEFLEEGLLMGISRRIKKVPKGFVVGETFVACAHVNIKTKIEDCHQGIFFLFKPRVIQYIMKGDETEEEILALQKRGFELAWLRNAERKGE